jgi:hypothetical protein
VAPLSLGGSAWRIGVTPLLSSAASRENSTSARCATTKGHLSEDIPIDGVSF